jgi:hypothetical protein
MTVQEVLLKALSAEVHWFRAAEILGSPRTLRRWREPSNHVRPTVPTLVLDKPSAGVIIGAFGGIPLTKVAAISCSVAAAVSRTGHA